MLNCNTSYSVKLGYPKDRLINRNLKIFFKESSSNPILNKAAKQTSLNLLHPDAHLRQTTTASLVLGSEINLQKKALNRMNKILFRKLAKNSKKTSQLMTFQKKNGFLISCMSDYKYSSDEDGNEYLTFICNFEKFTKPKAQILVNCNGDVIGHNSSTSTVLDLDQGLDLKESGYSNVQQLFSGSEVDIVQIFRMKTGSSKKGGKSLNLSRLSKKTSLANEKRLKKFKKTKIEKKLSKENTIDLITFNEIKLHLSVTTPANTLSDAALIELWKNDTKKSESRRNSVTFDKQSANNSATVSRLSKGNKSATKRTNKFYFSLNHEFKFYGSFDKKFASRSSNLNIKDLSRKELDLNLKSLPSSTQLLYKLRNQDQSNRIATKDLIDYGAGIRVKRLNKDGNLIDWFEGIDGDDSDSDTDDRDHRRGSIENMNLRLSRHKSKGKGKKKRMILAKREEEALKGSSRLPGKTRRGGAKKKRFGDFEDYDEESSNSVMNLTDKRPLENSFKNRGISKTLSFIIFSLLVTNACYFANITFSAYGRTIIANDLQLFAEIDYSISFRYGDMLTMQSNLLQIAMINNGTDYHINLEEDYLRVPDPEYGVSNEKLIENRLKLMKKSLESFENFNQKIVESIQKLSLKAIFDERLSRKDTIIHKSGTKTNFTLKQGLRQVVGSIATVLELPYDKLTFANQDVIFVLQNTRLHFFQSLVMFGIFADIIKKDVVLRQETSEVTVRYFLSSIFAINFVLLYLGIFLYYRSREAYIRIYYGFSAQRVQKLIKKCERYLEYIQQREVDDEEIVIVSESNEDQVDDTLGSESPQNGRLSFDDFMGQIRARKVKGSLAPCFGWPHFLMTLFLLSLTLLRESTYVYQDYSINESLEVLSTVDRIALSEVWNSALFSTLEFSMFDFGEYGRGYQSGRIEQRRIFFEIFAVMGNDRSLKVRKRLNLVQFFDSI